MKNDPKHPFVITYNSDRVVCGYTLKDANYPNKNTMALHTTDDTQIVIANRIAFSKQLAQYHVCSHFVLTSQCHSDFVYVLKRAQTLGWEGMQSAPQGYDAIVTDKADVLIGVLTADCVPILLCDEECGVVAAVHAGWRGTASHIVQKCAKEMIDLFGCTPSAIKAYIAPAIGGCCYEVDTKVARFFRRYIEALKPKENEKVMVDLPLVNAMQLKEIGIEEVSLSNRCTACEHEQLFSYRKGDEQGRFLSFVALKG